MTLLNRLADHALNTAPATADTSVQPVAISRRGIQPVGGAGRLPAGPAAGLAQLPMRWLTDVLNTADNEPEHARVGAAGYIHVSSLIGFCSRQHAILRLHSSQPVIRNATGGHRVMWRMGRAAEEHVRDNVVRQRRRDVMGRWSCVCGQTTHLGHLPDRTCNRCQQPINRYGEMTLTDDEAKIVGNPDLLIREAGFYVPVEIKSMNKKDWDKLEAPKGDHVFQVVAYARMLKTLRYPTHRYAIIVYVAKDFVFGSPYKEYQVDTESPSLVGQWERAREAARQAHEGIQRNALPPRVICEAPTSGPAKACPCVAQCWSRE